MLKNSCFFIICGSYCSLPELTFIVKMYFFVACEVTFIAVPTLQGFSPPC